MMRAALERLLAGPTGGFTRSLGFLARRLPTEIIPLSESETWKPLRENLGVYRNYLTHAGTLYRVYSDASGKTFVLQRKHLESKDQRGWSKEEKMHAFPTDWQELGEACRQVVRDTIALLDFGYQMRAEQMRNLVTHAAYQTLWGWKDHMPEIPNPPPSLQGIGFGSGTGIRDVLVGSAVSADIYTAQRQLSSTEINSNFIPGSGTRPI
jgi:hypothetical protein